MIQEPVFLNSDLSAEYQDWTQQLMAMNDINQINDLKKRLLTYISDKRKERYDSAQKLKNNLNKARTGTPEEKKEALENIEKNEGQNVYEAQKEAITKLKVEQASENSVEYSEGLIQKLTEKLTENELSETDLSSKTKTEYEKLKAGEIKDPTQLVATENSITKNIYQIKVNKELTDLITETNLVLNSNNKNQIEQIKNKLLAFINNTNIYYSEVHKTEARKSLAKLENHVITNNTNNNLSLSTKIVISLGIGLVMFLMLLLIIRKKKNKFVKK